MGIYAPFKIRSQYFFIVLGEPAFKSFNVHNHYQRSSTLCLDVGLRHMLTAPLGSKLYLVPTKQDVIVPFSNRKL